MSTFHVPSLVRSGARPGPVLAPGIEPLATWGGAMTREEDTWRALMAADGLILALTLAGYDADQLAIAVPAGGGGPGRPGPAGGSLRQRIRRGRAARQREGRPMPG